MLPRFAPSGVFESRSPRVVFGKHVRRRERPGVLENFCVRGSEQSSAAHQAERETRADTATLPRRVSIRARAREISRSWHALDLPFAAQRLPEPVLRPPACWPAIPPFIGSSSVGVRETYVRSPIVVGGVRKNARLRGERSRRHHTVYRSFHAFGGFGYGIRRRPVKESNGIVASTHARTYARHVDELPPRVFADHRMAEQRRASQLVVSHGYIIALS